MNGNRSTSLVRIYDELRDPNFVIEHGTKVVEDSRESFTTKAVVPTRSLGNVTIESIYFVGSTVAIPVMILSLEQLEILRKNHIFVIARKRKLLADSETFICIPNRGEIERIDAL